MNCKPGICVCYCIAKCPSICGVQILYGSIKVSKYSQKYPVYQVDILPSFYSLSNVKERENTPFLSTLKRRDMCTPLYIDSNTQEGNILKYIHVVYQVISARDHTILPPRGDKISYFSYFHVFSIHFLILGKGGRRVWPRARLISI